MTRSYSIIGAGALGGYYGARLAHAGCAVRFLLRSDFDHVARHGLRVESIHGDFSLPKPEIYRRVEDMPRSDVVLIGLKTTRNPLLGDLLPPATAGDAVVLDMQNGLGIEADVARVVPGRTILGGLAFLCSNKVGPGHVKHLDYGQVRLAEYRADDSAAGITTAVREIARDFEGAGVGVDLEADLATARWKKLVWNVPYNGLCAVHRCETDQIMADSSTRARAGEIMREVLAVAAAAGHPIDPAFADTMLEFTQKMAPYNPSMKLDHERGEPLEIDALYARPLAVARRVGVACPQIAELHEELVALDRRAD